MNVVVTKINVIVLHILLKQDSCSNNIQPNGEKMQMTLIINWVAHLFQESKKIYI